MNIVCYMGGTCGDLIVSVIDPKHTKFHESAMKLPLERYKLKKPHLFSNDEEKTEYIKSLENTYLSIPSHDTPYHIKEKHNFISISVTDLKSANWAASRFKGLHAPHVWEEMVSYSGARTVKDYANSLIHYSELIKNHTDKLINLNDILNGNLIEHLSKYISTPLSKNLYKNWLDFQNRTFII